MALPVIDQPSVRTAMQGYCRVVANITDFARPAIEEVITGVNTTNGFYLGGLSEEPSIASEDELLDFVENIYGANGPIKGAWAIQSTTTTLTASFLKLTPRMFSVIFPDYEDVGAWQGASPDDGVTPGETYGQIITRSGNVLEENYLDNVCLCFQGQTDNEIGMIWRLNNVVNRADSKEFSPDGDGNLSGVECELQAHEDLAQLSGAQRVPPMSVYLPTYMAETVAA